MINHMGFRTLPTPELLIAHDGTPVTLANVAAMLLPWLSTKKDDADAAGRFGIGQRTLESLGGPITFHALPFHFSIGSSGPRPAMPHPDVRGVYQAERRDTLLAIPLSESVTADSRSRLRPFLELSGAHSLLRSNAASRMILRSVKPQSAGGIKRQPGFADLLCQPLPALCRTIPAAFCLSHMPHAHA